MATRLQRGTSWSTCTCLLRKVHTSDDTVPQGLDGNEGRKLNTSFFFKSVMATIFFSQ